MLTVFNQSLWGDEAFSAILSMRSVPQIISTIIKDTSPPLFNLTEHFWFKIFGTSEIAIRALVFLYFLVAVFFVYKIGETLWDRKTGLIAALLTFLNPFVFAYGFEGRMYSLLLATVTASMYFFIAKKWPAYVIAATLALYSHHFAIFAVLVQGLWFLKEVSWGEKKIAFSMFKSFVAIGILYLPWLYPLYKQVSMFKEGYWLGTPTLKDLGELLLKYLNVSLILLALRKWNKNLDKSILLVLWFLVPILATWLLSQKITSIFYDRYLLYTIPAAMLLAASEMRFLSKIVLLIVVIIFASADYVYFTHPMKRPFRDLAIYVKEVKKGDDYLINWNSAAHHLWEAKYYGIPAPLYLPEGTKLPFYVGTALMTPEDTTSTLPKKINRVGVITSGSVDEISLPGYVKTEEKDFGSLKFLWFSRSLK
jgi:uncharacterized membrane protein